MGAKSPVRMFSGDDLGFLGGDRGREIDICRSGSAPPTVEGSLNSIGELMGNEEEIRATPAYLSYYYSNVNLNPRLPPPVLSRDDWRSTQRLGGIGDRRKAGRGEEEENGGGEWVSGGGDGLIGLSLGRRKSLAEIFQEDSGRTASAPDFPSRPAGRNAFDSGEPSYTADGYFALNHDIASASGLRSSRNDQTVIENQNKASRTFAGVLASSLSRDGISDSQQVTRVPSPSLPDVDMRLGVHANNINNGSHSFTGVTSDPVKSDDLLAALSGMNLSSASAVVTGNISQLKSQQEIDAKLNYLHDLRSTQNFVKQCSFSRHLDPGHSSASSIPNPVRSSYLDSTMSTGLLDFSNSNSVKSSYLGSTMSGTGLPEFSNSNLSATAQAELRRPIFVSNSYLNASSVASPGDSPIHYQQFDYSDGTDGLSGYLSNRALSPRLANHIGTGSLPPLFENAAAASAVAALCLDSSALATGFPVERNLNGLAELQSPNPIGSRASISAAAALQMHLADPRYIQYLKAAEYAAQAAVNLKDSAMERGYMGNSYLDLLGMQDACLGGLLQHRNQFNPFLSKSGPASPDYFGHPAFGLNMSYPGSPLASPVPASPVGPHSPVRHAERNLRFHPGLSSFTGGIMGSWNPGLAGDMDEDFPTTLLEEFKTSKTRSFELSDISGHVVEFSADQYGSRFIQQKLETATTEEKDIVFEEIMPQALSLMTDVFGNYVTQKFFEHGNASQIRELANQLNGHVLALSLQMYGCRVIQKAIEVVDLDQQRKMVAELDGHIMRCVRDQNGNHVIQKCIECIPQDAIQFIISSFYNHVVTLSTHPYGCRVIQRVLEHCGDPETQQIFMDEIMQCVCILAQDQYGNYVVQHVLEHGKPEERSAIIKQLAGQIVQMSQQKFASNVVEKCLTFGGPVERQILVNEMLGSTDENEPLQAMMKDQFANYVVQKVLETCDNQQRELILSRIKVHLNALKKYTYGKHIVARVEKLVAAGERRIGLQSSYPSLMD